MNRESQSPGIPAISDYAVIGDGRTIALIARDGSIEWLCFPHFAGRSVFAALLDRDNGGAYRIAPAAPFKASRRYIPGTPVLETTFETANGRARVVDFFPADGGPDRLVPMREVIRIIEGVEGSVAFDILIDPRPNYGRVRPTPKNRGPLGWAYVGMHRALMIRAETELTCDETALRGRPVLKAGERCAISLAFVENDIGVIPILGPEIDARLRMTIDWWTAWSDRCSYRGPHRAVVVRSAITLKLLTYCLSGAVTAAATTSLPEVIGGMRNWDYRYCWMRDAGMTVQAMVTLGYMDEARFFLSWMLHATRATWPKLRVLYDIYGRSEVSETELPHLSGYRGSKPVRVGNAASTQRQLDVYGEILLASDAYVEGGGTLEAMEQRMLKGFGKTVCAEWRKPDHSIWEIRGVPRHYTFSKMMCWLALDRLIALEGRGILRLGKLSREFHSEREKLRETIETQGFNAALGSYVASFDTDFVDASLLLCGCVGYRDASDPRMVATYKRIWETLGTDGLLRRYDPRFDGMPGREGAFIVLSFWAVQNLAARGEVDAAETLFDHLLRYGNDLGLFSEEFDPECGEALGNTPQAFSHTGLINAAVAITQARTRTTPAGPRPVEVQPTRTTAGASL